MVHGSKSRGRRWFGVVGALMLVVAACGGGDDGTGGTDEPGGTQARSGPGATNAPSGPGGGSDVEGAVVPQTFAVNQAFFQSGFRVEIVSGELSVEQNALTGAVRNFLTITATIENLGADEAYFFPEVNVSTDANSYTPGPLTEIPTVAGGLKAQATFGYSIDADFDLASAQVIVGRADENRAIVPLNEAGDAVRLEPSDVDVSGTLSMELLDLVFTGGELRYDFVATHGQVEAGKQALTLHFDAVSRRGGNWNVFADDLALVMPDGTAIGADGVNIGGLPGSDEGTTTPDRSVRFLVDEMASGTVTLRLAPGDWFVGDDGVTEATFEFTLP